MSKLFDAATTGDARTQNGCATNSTTSDLNLDLFFAIGGSRGKNLSSMFSSAYRENSDYALRIMQHARDVRGGVGERQQFRDLFAWLIKHNPEMAARVAVKIPEIGRWDDVLVMLGTPLQDLALEMIRAALADGNQLCAKWMPRPTKKHAKTAKIIHTYLGMEPKLYRKLIVGLTNVVEQKMCANKWDTIEYSHLPSKAAARYQKAFGIHDAVRYNEYIAKLEKGEAKINAGAIFPHDVVLSARTGNNAVATQQWAALPNYMEATGHRILPVIDVSGSMGCGVGGSASVSCMDAAIAMGMYVAERNIGPFKDEFITFSETPKMMKIQGSTLRDRYINVKNAPWGYNTNFIKVFELILAKAKQNKLTNEDLPTMVIVFSDMEFDSAGGSTTAQQKIQQLYDAAGFEVPTLVYWNLHGSGGNNPVKAYDKNTALVSGFSPAILTSVLSGGTDPVQVMLDAIMKPRYDY